MKRRDFIFSSVAVLPVSKVQVDTSNQDDDAAELAECEALAKTLADIELNGLKADHPDSWRDVSYIGETHVNERWTAIYCVTSDMRLLDRWSMRVERAIYPGKLMVYALAKAGPIAGMDEGYNIVTLMICDRHSVGLESVAFADLKAKYPLPVGH